MRDDNNYQMRIVEAVNTISNCLTLSDFTKNKSIYAWLNNQRQALKNNELPIDRKQALDTYLPMWNQSNEDLIREVHKLKVVEMYNQGYTGVKELADCGDVEDVFVLVSFGVYDIQSLMSIPSNILLEKMPNLFLSELQNILKEGFFKPTERAMILSKAIPKMQYKVISKYNSGISRGDLTQVWLFRQVQYTKDLKVKELNKFNYCSPTWYNSSTGQIEQIIDWKNFSVLYKHSNMDSDISVSSVSDFLPTCWNDNSKFNEILNTNKFTVFHSRVVDASTPKRRVGSADYFMAEVGNEFAPTGVEMSGPSGEFN